MSPWPEADFDDLVADETGGNAKTLQSDYLPEGTYPIVDQGQSLIGGYTNDRSRVCKAQLPVIVFGDHTKCFKYIDFPFCLGADGTKVLRPKRILDERYLFYALQRIHIPDAGYSRHFKYLKEGKIPLPPLEEQKRIAAILDQADELRRKRKRALDRLNQLGQAIFIEMFGDRITSAATKICIGDVSERVTKGESPKWQGHSYVDEGALFVTSENVGWGKLLSKEPKFIPMEFHNGKLRRSKLQTDDILINLVGASIGRACIFKSDFREANINQAVAVVTLKDGPLLSEYLLTYLLSPWGQEQILGSRVEGARANISLADVRNFEFYMPPAEHLAKFARKMATVSHLGVLTSNALTVADGLFTSLQHRAFSGELTASNLKEAAE